MIANTTGMQLKQLPPGTFLMGEAGGQHEVTLTEPFQLGIFPVTQAEYERVMNKNPSEFQGDERGPVESVNWFDAIDFCNRLSQQEGLPPYYDVKQKKVTLLGGQGYRLPTEAEWEYACRASSQGAYCFGDDESKLHEYAWFSENAEGKTHPVGEKQPNAWGLHDMHGNVWEWCWDWSGNYQTPPPENPVGPAEASNRVIRGGGQRGDAWYCRSVSRTWNGPMRRGDDLGFRLARISA